MEIFSALFFGFLSGIAAHWLTLRIFLTDLRPATTGRVLLTLVIVAMVVLCWLFLIEFVLGAVANSQISRDSVGRIFLASFTAGLWISVLYKKFRKKP